MRKNKVVWAEGAFLQTQHFQQQERYLEAMFDQRIRSSQAYGWGFTSLVIDQSLLAQGQISILSAAGILPDGTPFNFPEDDAPPLALSIDKVAPPGVVYLAVPLERPGVPSVSLSDTKQATMHRFISHVQELNDCNEGFDEAVPVQLGKLDLRLVTETEQLGGYATLGAVRLGERRADASLSLHPGFIPPVLDVSAAPLLSSWLNEVRGLLYQRSEVLAQRLSRPGKGGMGEVADFLFLMIVNRYASLLGHLSAMPTLHPERLYSVFIQIAGELSSFGKERHVVHPFPPYNHDALEATFRPVMEQLRVALSMVLEQTALQIDLLDRKYGVRVAIIHDKKLIQEASFVLAVNAQLAAETVRMRFPTQVKIGTIEKIRDLVNLQLQGIALRTLPVAPRQIPYHAGFNYFELDQENELWRSLPQSGGLAMHISGEFPGLELELWAIRK